MKRSIFILVCIFFLTGLIALSPPESPEKAIRKNFPSSDIEVKNFLLSPEQKRKVELLSQVKVEDNLISFYVIKEKGLEVAFGYVDVHVVRTHHEAVLYLIGTDARILNIQVLSFKEPAEYLPGPKWLSLFQDKNLKQNKLKLRDDISAISGATLSARAVTNHCRKALALWQVLFDGE